MFAAPLHVDAHDHQHTTTIEGDTMRQLIAPLALAASLVLGACASAEPGADTSLASSTTTLQAADELGASVHEVDQATAPAHLITSSGGYSDVRFCVMMAAHHQHAIDMAQIAVASATHPEVRALAQKMIDDQTNEIEELRNIRQSHDGSRRVATMMNPHQMMNGGVPMPAELTSGIEVDAAFLDGMLPHHGGAIQMASAALRHSQDAQVAALSRRIIDAQAKEIAQMDAMRSAWYAGVNHGFPHAP